MAVSVDGAVSGFKADDESFPTLSWRNVPIDDPENRSVDCERLESPDEDTSVTNSGNTCTLLTLGWLGKK
ncbi:MAG: hypothetical protein Q9199_001019 [Rusavskia elegans]